MPNFIFTLEELYSVYCNEATKERDGNYWLLFKAVLSHLEGPAEAVVNNNNCSNVIELNNALKNNFADNRTIPDLIAELALMKCRPREHPIEFFNRLEEKRTTVITRYKLDGITDDLLTDLTRQLNATLIRTLTHGVHPTLGSHLQLLQIKTLKDARNKLINDCSIVLQQLKFSTTIDTINIVD